jgi:glutamate---cysteine ligase / carboxylate-amine ligase
MSNRPETSTILAGVRERFATSTDFTIGLEEEFQILDPVTLGLVNRFEDVAAAADPALRDQLAGELIASEIEFKTRPHADLTHAARELAQGRLDLCSLAERLGLAMGITGVHPFSPWTQQRIIDTPHYRLVESELGYLAWTNNTWALHLHCGVRDADRAVKVATRMRSVLPDLLALSANSPIFGGRDTRLASTRTQVFVRSFPRCGIPDAYADWDDYAANVAFLERAGAISESTQIWWSVRPHHAFGTIEVRICDGQTELGESLALAALIIALIAEFCAQLDEGRTLPVHPRAHIEENLWRAERHGLDGQLIDLATGRSRPTRAAITELLEATRSHHGPLGLTTWIDRVSDTLEHGNGAIRQRALLDAYGGDVRAVHAQVVERTRASAQEILSQHTTGAPA